MNKKGMEIAINQIIILIIGIVIFGLGLSLVMRIMSTGGDQIDGANQQIIDQMSRTLSSRNVVDIPRNNRPMQSNHKETFHLGILHEPSVKKAGGNQGNKFYIIITPSSEGHKGSIHVLDNDIHNCNTESSVCIIQDIKPNEIDTIPILISPKDASLGRGQYVYNVCICDGASCEKEIKECNSETISYIDNLYGFKTFSINIR